MIAELDICIFKTKLSLSILLILIFNESSFSQQIKLKGVVQDSLSKPIPFVNVILTTEDSITTNEFALTDATGEFEFELVQNLSYTLTFLHIAYVRKQVQIIVPSEGLSATFVLTDKIQDLGEFELSYQIPIQVKTDSVIYDLSQFTSGSERKLKEALLKLPGVEIDKNGTVKLIGKKVAEVLVEGRTFFNGTTKLAIDNIPSNAIEKIEFIDNYQKVNFLKGLGGDKLVMNLKLKENKKKILFGDISVGGGHQSRYQTNSTLFYYHPRVSTNLILDANNIGQKSLGFEDYLGFQDISKIFVDAENFMKSINDLSDYFFQSDPMHYQELFLGTNIQLHTSKLDVNGFIMSSSSASDFKTINTNGYFLDDNSMIQEVRKEDRELTNSFKLARLNMDFSRSDSKYFSSVTSFRSNTKEELVNISTRSDASNNLLLSQSDFENWSFSQSFSLNNKLSAIHTLSIDFYTSLNNRLPSTWWQSNSRAFAVNLEEAEVYRIKQSYQTKDYGYSISIKDYIRFNPQSLFSIEFNSKLSKFEYNTSESQLLDNQMEIPLSGFQNELSYTLASSYLGTDYKIRLGQSTINSSIKWNYYSWKTNPNVDINHKMFLLISPSLNWKYDLGKTEHFNVDYRLEYNFPSPEQVAINNTLNNFNQVFTGNSNLSPTLSHLIGLKYRKYNLIKGNNIDLDLNYSLSVKSIASDILLNGIYSTLSPMMVHSPRSEFKLRTDYGKRFKYIKTNISLNYSQRLFPQRINSEDITNRAESISTSLGISTVSDNQLILTLGYTLSFNQYGVRVQNKFLSHNILTESEYQFRSGTRAVLRNSLILYKDITRNNQSTYHSSDLIMRSQNNSGRWVYEIELRNIFNNRFIRTNSLNEHYTSDQQIYIQPGTLIFKVSCAL
ncbi:carboxypeptidase regulatory-like domain-containing protein [Roseivirga sp.]|uniref:carboxypeptidase regulatory-like domain-containing protein n=1 Tax=Roseivirga sp. TaxID=1964215 RepID=UPI003B51774B